ncbi:serine--tRNA ligase [Saccharibacillus sp. CPCC 101409]|uniref:serine--tRNA ligase n=1 Tax=Saccharibacillus sp. CPCC 101409 TaxID=3058041 RepID=UPI002672D867|nr:serine--tRNA ligase [Saccharibacillus sp. CPCC 101409]MDO3411404.1 serine--tRNA ligase [Saccharibacillus sp. CPCC 101409]
MMDIRDIREREAEFQTAADGKGIAISIRELLETDDRRRSLAAEAEALRERRNRLSREIGGMAGGDRSDMQRLKQEVRTEKAKLEHIENELQTVLHRYRYLMDRVPNLVSPDTPAGASDADNVTLSMVGIPTQFDFTPRDHVELGELHRLFDLERGVKVAGTRSYFLKGDGLRLHRAVQQLALDLLEDRGFTAMDVPLMVRTKAMRDTGFFPTGQDQAYRIEGEDAWLVGTSEVPLIAYYSDEILDPAEPIRAAGVSTCFRSEVGSAGRDVRGLYRVHQFAKVEQIVICRGEAEESEALLQEITRNAENLLDLLELPYRKVAVCIGDMSQKNYKQYDLETWMPGRDAYGETHSSSNVGDFQARRAGLRYRGEDGKLRYCHTLNNTAAATPRLLIPLIENHQRADGSIYLPPALRPYMGGREMLEVPAGRAGLFHADI